MTAIDEYRKARDLLLDQREDHGAMSERFRWPTVEGSFNWATDYFDQMARGNDRPALRLVEEDGSSSEFTFEEMARRSDRLAGWMQGHGIGRGDVVLVMLGNQVELWDSMLALMKLGAVIAPTTTALGASDLRDRIDRAQAKALIVAAQDTARLDWLADVTDLTRFSVGAVPGWQDLTEGQNQDLAQFEESWTTPTQAQDPLLLYFTSGTTSRPKLVLHTQVSYPIGHLTTMYWLGIRPGDVHMTIASPGWAKHAWSCFFAPWIAEATIFSYNYTRFDAPALLDQLRRNKVNTFCAPPTVWRMLIQADLSGGPGDLHEVIGAGEPLNPEVIEQVRNAWGMTIRDGYGQTETTALIGNTPGSAMIPGSMGRPLPGVPIVLLDPVTGQPVEGEGEGELCLDLAAHPVNLMTGYQGDPERTAESMAGGYYHTGDVASRDAEGYITFVGRTDDVFKASDYKISPFELESVLIEHPAVAEAAVVPAPDDLRLAVPKAYVTLAAGWDADEKTAFEILKHSRANLSAFQRVRRVEFRDLPKTVSGKIRRVELRQLEEELARQGQDAALEFREEQFPELRA